MSADGPSSRSEPRVPTVRFGAFDLDVRAGELRKYGVKVRLQEQPLQILLMLLQRAGEVVLREEIRKRLWPNDTIVEFGHGINAAIQRLRDALGDSADNPRYVETVARRGYRFIGELGPECKDQLSPTRQAAPENASPPPQPPADASSPDISDLSGHTISHYRVYEKIGSGGMGEVYRARDLTLGREVALKVLPEEFAHDADRMARFEREAQVLASLNHPNIATIYGVEDANGIRALVMELVEGPTLAERIARGAVPVEEALGMTQQIANALDAAHENGVVHRDLKPANIKVTRQGVVKMLDFGLAAVMQGSVPTLDDPENSPTRTAIVSSAGVILGTAAYMAPEQARGEAVDKRADIWAFGVLLYEMLTGKRLFEGETTTEILSAVLTQEPEWKRVPARAQRLLQSCLEKDPKRRLRDIGDAWRQLGDGPPVKDERLRMLPWAFAGVMLLTTLFLTYLYSRSRSQESHRVQFTVLPPDKTTFSGDGVPAVSPDGRLLAFVATNDGKDSLWVRELDSGAARRLPGTEGAYSPFWSPDSRFIAFFADWKLRKIDVTGGPPVALWDAADSVGGSWNQQDVILLTPNHQNTPLFRVSAAGGSATPVTELDKALGETVHLFPWFLPDGRHFLYTAVNIDPEKTAVYVGDLYSKSRHRVVVANHAMYSPPGYLLFVREGALMAQHFDATTTQTIGHPIPIAELIEYTGFGAQGQFSVSRNGVLTYGSGRAKETQQLTWFDRSGRVLGTVGTPGLMEWPALSPDGDTLAIGRIDGRKGSIDIWLHDLKRGNATRFTFDFPKNDTPIWSPDGTHILFRAMHDGEWGLFQKATTGAAQEEPLDTQGQFPLDWSRDGHYIIYSAPDPKLTGKYHIWVLPLFGDRKPFLYLPAQRNETLAKLSPNGKWLAYASDETGRFEIYVQAFPTPSGKWQVSTNGAEAAVWSRDGKELFFTEAGRKLMVVEVKGGAKFEASAPKFLFDLRTRDFDVTKDGRFLVPAPLEQTASIPITVMINWTAGLTK